ncbi:MAG: hypothetical protein U1E56_01550 [Bauldia sp.]
MLERAEAAGSAPAAALGGFGSASLPLAAPQILFERMAALAASRPPPRRPAEASGLTAGTARGA